MAFKNKIFFMILVVLSLGITNLRALPKPDHVGLVIEENHSYSQIMGSKDCAYIHELAKQVALLTQSHAVSHPSQPNYLVLFSGSVHGINDHACTQPKS